MKYSLIDKTHGSVRADVLSGVTVALALVPEAVAFAFVAGVSPVVGLYGAFLMGLVTSVFGGRPGMISGATGAMAVVMVSLVAEGGRRGLGEGAGLQYLFAALLLTGIIQVTAGALKLGRFVRMIPSPVMMGFVNGLAIVILLSQLGMFRVGDVWLRGEALYRMLGLVLATMAIMVGLPKLTKKVPAALSAIVIVSLVVVVADLDTETVASFVAARGGAGIEAGLPTFAIPVIPLSWSTFAFIAPYALILAAIGLIESLMTLNLVDDLTETRGNANRECLAQGAANIVNGFFGGMGGCAMIGQSIINIKSGGRGRLSGIVASLTLLGFILFGAAYIELVPIAALVGVMMMVVIGTFAWNTFGLMNKVPAADVVVMLLVTTLTVLFDLAVAVCAGVVVSALVFAWQKAANIRTHRVVDERGALHYNVSGPLFFASTAPFLAEFDVAGDPDDVIIDFAESRVMDQSAIEAINKLADRYQKAGKNLKLRHLSADCIRLIRRAERICDVDIVADPEYYVAIDDYEEALAHALGASDARNVGELVQVGKVLQRNMGASHPPRSHSAA